MGCEIQEGSVILTRTRPSHYKGWLNLYRVNVHKTTVVSEYNQFTFRGINDKINKAIVVDTLSSHGSLKYVSDIENGSVIFIYQHAYLEVQT